MSVIDHLALIRANTEIDLRLALGSAKLTFARRRPLAGALRTASGLRRIRPMSEASPRGKP